MLKYTKTNPNLTGMSVSGKPKVAKDSRRDFLRFGATSVGIFVSATLFGCRSNQQRPTIHTEPRESDGPSPRYTRVEDLEVPLLILSGDTVLSGDFDIDRIANRIRENTSTAEDVGHMIAATIDAAQRYDPNCRCITRADTLRAQFSELTILAFQRLDQTLNEIYAQLPRAERRPVEGFHSDSIERISHIMEKIQHREIDQELIDLFNGISDDEFPALGQFVLDGFRDHLSSGTPLTDANHELITNHYWMASTMIGLLLGNEPSLPEAVNIEFLTGSANNIRLNDADISHRLVRAAHSDKQK